MSVVSGGDEPAVLARQTSLPWRVWPACGGDGDLGHLPVAAHPRRGPARWVAGLCVLFPSGTLSRVLPSETRDESQAEKQGFMIKETQGLRAMKRTQSVSPRDGAGRRDGPGPASRRAQLPVAQSSLPVPPVEPSPSASHSASLMTK